MKILITLPPIRFLIGRLRFLLAASHPKSSFFTIADALNPNYEERIKDKDPKEVDFLKLFTITKETDPKTFSMIWGTYSSALSRVGMPSFKIARKTFSTTARRLGVDEGYTRTMLGQKDKSVSISYVDYDDPKLFAKLCLEHIKVLRAFDAIGIYNKWVKKIDEVFGTNWSSGPTYFKQNPEHIYSAFAIALQKIIDSDKSSF